MKLSDLTAVGRLLDPRYPTNLTVMAVALIVNLVVGKVVWGDCALAAKPKFELASTPGAAHGNAEPTSPIRRSAFVDGCRFPD